MKHLKYRKEDVMVAGRATFVEGSASLKDGTDLVNTAKKLLKNTANLLALTSTEEYSVAGLTDADEADVYDEKVGVVVASMKAELSSYQMLLVDMKANMKALKAYEADTPEERLAAFTEIYEHYGIEMLPEEKEIILKKKNYRFHFPLFHK